jgi:hypothetical protein
VDYAQAVSVERGRCFKWVYDVQGKPKRCPEPLTVTGWVKIDRRHEVDACAEHSIQRRQPRREQRFQPD